MRAFAIATSLPTSIAFNPISLATAFPASIAFLPTSVWVALASLEAIAFAAVDPATRLNKFAIVSKSPAPPITRFFVYPRLVFDQHFKVLTLIFYTPCCLSHLALAVHLPSL